MLTAHSAGPCLGHGPGTAGVSADGVAAGAGDVSWAESHTHCGCEQRCQSTRPGGKDAGQSWVGSRNGLGDKGRLKGGGPEGKAALLCPRLAGLAALTSQSNPIAA